MDGFFAQVNQVAFDFPSFARGKTHAWESVSNLDPRIVSMVMSFLAHQIVWVVLNGMFGSMDYFSWGQRYKLPRRTQPTRALVLDCLKLLFVSHYIIQPVALYFLMAPIFLGKGVCVVCSV